MDFSNAIREDMTWTTTENGADCLNTTGSKVLDFFGVSGALRKRDEGDICRLFDNAYQEDANLALKTLFYSRDIREGLGERRTFRTLLKHCAQKHPSDVIPLIPFIGVYGRFDDLYSLMGTPAENKMWEFMRKQIVMDFNNYADKKSISLLAKWIATPDSHSETTKRLGCLTAKKLGFSVYEFKRILRKLRKYLNIVESKMADNDWESIDYSTVPSRAMMIYRKAFQRHNEEGFSAFITKVKNGEEKINASTLYPYDIVEKFLYNEENSDVLEAQWNAMPDYVNDEVNAIVMADVSGSMCGRPMATSIGLAMYFAEHNKGAYHNLFMTFSGRPEFVEVRGKSLHEKIRNLSRADWSMNTNLQAAFERILDVAVRNNCKPEEMVKSLIIVSDMEIDQADNSRGWTFYDAMAKKFVDKGYVIPNIIFWNVESRHDTFHVDKDRKGVQLLSGASTTTFKTLLDNIGLNPVEAMLKVLNSDRYAPIKIYEI